MADNINDLISQAYAGIGRSDTGTGLAAITQGEKDYWAGQVASGALTPDNFQAAFNAAVNEYKAANPDDPYTQYVNNYQAQQAPASGGIASLMTLQNAANAVKAPQEITPQTAQDLMWRSMTTGVPTSEFDKYGGYDAVAKAFTNAGGQYDRSTIPTDTLKSYAQTVANTGVGDLGLLDQFNIPLTSEAVTNMQTNQTYNPELVNQYQKGIYDQLVDEQYGTIGRTGIGTAPSNIDQSGRDYWSSQLASGAISQADFAKTFADAVREYKKAHPDDEYTKYVNEYQLGQQKDALNTNLGNILADNKITLEEANAIQAYQDNYGFNAADIARITNKPIEVINQVLGARGNILSQGYEANLGNALGLADYALNNKLSAKDLSSASGGALTEADAQNLITKASTTAGRLELASPEAYSQIKNIISRAVDKDYHGQEADWMYMMFTGLDPNIASSAPAQLDLTPAKTETRTGYDGESGTPYTYQAVVTPATPTQKGVEAVYGASDENGPGAIEGYRKKIENSGGIKDLYADYDVNGKLTGYSSDSRIYTSDPNYYLGAWDATGAAKPTAHHTSSGGVAGIAESLGEMGHDLVGDTGWTILKLFPPTAPYVNALDAVNAYNRGDTTGAITNAVASYAGYQGNVATDSLDPSSVNYANAADRMSDIASTGSTPGAVAAANAANARLGLAAMGAYQAATSDNPNYTPLLNVAASVSGIADNPTAANAFNTLGVINAGINKDMSGLFNAAGNLTGNKDLNLAAAANNFRKAYESGNESAIVTAGVALTTAAENNARTSSAVDTLKNFVTNSIPSVKGESVNIVDQLKDSGLTETTPDLSTLTAPDGTKYTMLEEEDLTQGTQVAGPGGGEPGKFAPGTYTKTATNLFANVEMPDGSTKSVSVLVRPDGSLTPTSGSADDAESVKVLRVDPNRIDKRFLDTRQITVPKTPDEIEALSKVTGKSAGDVSDAPVKYEVPKEQTPASMLKHLRGAGFDENFNTYAFAHASDPQFIQELARELEDTIDDPNLNAVYKELTGSYYPGSKLYNATAPLTPVVQGSLNPWGPVAHVTVDGLTEGAGEVVDTSVDPSSGIRVTTQVDTNTNTETTTKIDPTTGTSIQIITTPDLFTQVVTNTATNTQTKTITDLATNVSTTVKVDLSTGSVTVVPPAEPPVVPPVVPPVIPPTEPPVVPPTTPADKTTTTPTDTAKTTGPTGLTKSQASQMAAAFGVPNLANVFYYGKDFSSFEEETDEEGKLKKKKYKPLSVTKAGAELPDIPEESVESKSKSKDNNVLAMLEQILGRGSEAASEKELQNIVKGTK